MYCKKCGEYMNDGQAVCLNCGVAAGTGKEYCPNCGNKVLTEEAVICVKCGTFLHAQEAKPTIDTSGMKPRSIVKAIIFSFLTCGIYTIFWFINLTNDINKASGRTGDTSGGIAYLLSLVTCGIYTYFWAYKLGEKRDIIANEKNGYSNILYLVLCILGFGIVVYGLAQDTLNKAIENN